eukprot:gnl/TRDRNA2_/TRDRNA2_166395_c0_seq2.p1 gnl/TRDRNA2_/TRDRNA2_166395_c0~~gnl/TRDRNA2_/TRDRNA2_166395_c0_seq2.p1  ORF type:complete len:271 (+),score=38.91 gnl/TRDRNA2_/TRDRNA2_166395_c0_seq2:89-901(+)
MMAARVGADVWCVEMHPLLRGVTAECIAHNAEKLRGNVVLLPPMLSTQLRVGHELPHRMDLIVSEVLDAELISEGVIVSLRHAKEELLTAEGVLLPHGATAFYAPIECTPVNSSTASFDLTAVDDMFSLSCHPFRYDTMPHRLLAPAKVGFEFNFYELPWPKPGAPMMVTSPQLGSRMDRVQVTEAGTLDGVGYWFDVHLAEVRGQTFKLQAGPGCQQRTWKQNCRFSLNPRHVEPDETLQVICAYDDSTLYFVLSEDNGGEVFGRLAVH